MGLFDKAKKAKQDAADAMAEGFDVDAFLGSGPRMCIKPSSTVCSQEATVWATDDALALSFTVRYADDWRYWAAWGKWLVWTGTHWQSDETLLVHHLIRSICREAAVKVDSHRLAAKLLASSTVGGVDRLARSDRRHQPMRDLRGVLRGDRQEGAEVEMAAAAREVAQAAHVDERDVVAPAPRHLRDRAR